MRLVITLTVCEVEIVYIVHVSERLQSQLTFKAIAISSPLCSTCEQQQIASRSFVDAKNYVSK